MNIVYLFILLFLISLFPKIAPVFIFLLCFYIGFKITCRDMEVETRLKNYLVVKIKDFINKLD